MPRLTAKSVCTQSDIPCGIESRPSITASMANTSTLSFLNTSSTSGSKFSYIIPYNQTQDCNIYGPVCQTGSMTVAVNLTTTTSTVVLPCSSYLSAQSVYIESLNPDGFFQESYGIEDDPLVDWQTNFGESPECRAYANAIKKGQYTASNCGNNTTINLVSYDILFDSPSPIPPGVEQWLAEEYMFTCCGNCSLKIPEVRLFYFPVDTNVDCQNNQTSNLTSSVSDSIQKRVHSLVATGSTAVFSGYTL